MLVATKNNAKLNNIDNNRHNTITGQTSCNIAMSYSPFDSSKATADILSFRCCEPKGVNTPLNKNNFMKGNNYT